MIRNRYIIRARGKNPHKTIPFHDKQHQLALKTAIENVNNGERFRLDGKRLTLLDIQDESFVVQLDSREQLLKPTMSLRALSRQLLLSDKNSDTRFGDAAYGTALLAFDLEQTETIGEPKLSDEDAIRIAVTLFTDKRKTAGKYKDEVREILSRYADKLNL